MAPHPEVFPADTVPEALRVQTEVYRRMGPTRRGELALQLSDSLREFVAAGVRQRHPDWDAAAVRREVARLFLGDKLFREAEQARRQLP